MAVQRLLVAKPARHIDTDATRAEAKKSIQWAAIIIPTAIIRTIGPRPMRNVLPVNLMIKASASAAKSVRKKTSSTAGIEISLPRIAVKPQRKMIKCSSR